MSKKWIKGAVSLWEKLDQKTIPTLEDWSPKSDTITVSMYRYLNGARRVCVFAHVDGIGLTKDFDPENKVQAQELFDSITELSLIFEMQLAGMRLE